MKDLLTSCIETRRAIQRNEEKQAVIKAVILSPKSQAITGMPRISGGDPISAIDKYIIKQEALEQQHKELTTLIASQWNTAKQIMQRKGIDEKEIALMRERFYYGKSWNKCAKLLEWNENKVFRTYRKVLVKCNKNRLQYLLKLRIEKKPQK